jgi:hypothetical protein
MVHSTKITNKWCTRLAAASDKVYQLLAHGRWFSPGTPASSTTKTGRHDIAESGVKYNKSNRPFTLGLSIPFDLSKEWIYIENR